MANIKKHLDNIKGALYGKDVRGSIHDGIDAINKEMENTTGRQVDLEKTFDQLVINAGNSNAEIVDARVKSDGTSYSKLGDRLNEVDSRLEQITNNNINAKTLGMIANNKENADLNMSLLNEAIKKGVSVEIDDIYYIESNNTVNVENVCIKGVSPNACLILKGNDVWNINNGLHNLISITNINLKNEDEETVNLFTNSNTFPYVDRFIFSNNKVEGNITICKLYFLNSNIEKFGFNVVDISSNIFLNCMVDNHIFNINDCPHNEIRVVNNHIHNFNKVFAFIVLENNKNIDRVMSMKKCICYGNTIFNDDDVYCINSGDKYWGFLYYEGIDVDYFNNRVEGIKVNFPLTLDGKKVGLYDSYLSAINVNHHNNIIKNNINIYADEIEQCNNFFKSKNSPYKQGIRICKNNTFIIEKDYLDKISVFTSPKFKLYEFESEMDTLVYENNLIECPNIKLTQQNYQSMKVNNFKFNNNNIVSDNINGHFYQVNCLSNINCIEFCNNLITELKGNVDYKRLGFINITQNNNITNVEINKILISNNNLSGYFIENLIRGNDIGDYSKVKINNLELSNNTIKSNNSKLNDRGCITILDETKHTQGFLIVNFLNKNNSFYYNNDVTFSNIKTPVMINNSNYEINYKHIKNISVLTFVSDILYDKEYHINLKVTLQNKQNIDTVLKTSFTVYPDRSTNRNKVAFISPTDVNRYISMVKKTDTDFSDMHGELIKTNSDKEHEFMIYNSSSNGFYFPEIILNLNSVELNDIQNIRVDISTF